QAGVRLAGDDLGHLELPSVTPITRFDRVARRVCVCVRVQAAPILGDGTQHAQSRAGATMNGSCGDDPHGRGHCRVYAAHELSFPRRSRPGDLTPRPAVYETAALPLS